MALTTVSSDRLSTNVKTSNLGSELSKKVGQNKNLIINGAMTIQQRMNANTTGGQNLTGIKTVDRFSLNFSGTDNPPTQIPVDVASGTTPYTLGFRRCFKIINGDQTSGAGASDQIYISYKMEAQDIANSGWNYLSSSSNITLSFWVKSSVAQNFYGYLLTKDGSAYLYPFETGSLTADTWTKITKTIPGNSNLTFNNDNGSGLELVFAQFFGTDKTGSVSLNAWGAYNTSVRVPDMTSTWYTTNDATFEITGVQLEVGSVATDFEHRSFAQELALCKRYYYVTGDDGTTTNLIQMGVEGATVASGGAVHPVTMRAVPTVTIGGGIRFYAPAGGSTTFSITENRSSTTHLALKLGSISGRTAGQAGTVFNSTNDATGIIEVSGEL